MTDNAPIDEFDIPRPSGLLSPDDWLAEVQREAGARGLRFDTLQDCPGMARLLVEAPEGPEWVTVDWHLVGDPESVGLIARLVEEASTFTAHSLAESGGVLPIPRRTA